MALPIKRWRHEVKNNLTFPPTKQTLPAPAIFNKITINLLKADVLFSNDRPVLLFLSEAPQHTSTAGLIKEQKR